MSLLILFQFANQTNFIDQGFFNCTNNTTKNLIILKDKMVFTNKNLNEKATTIYFLNTI